jgi:small ligand-binding sensory domain FIST
METAASAEDWQARFQARTTDEPSLLILGDPYTVDVNALLGGINKHLPGRPVIGGMASGAEQPGQSALVLNGDVHREGAVGVALTGDVAITSVVSQGCRPVGRPLVITRAERNIIHELGGHPALAVLQAVYAEASEADQGLLQQGIFLGRVIHEQKAEFHRGDFLIRNVMGVDPGSGAVAVGDLVRVGICSSMSAMPPPRTKTCGPCSQRRRTRRQQARSYSPATVAARGCLTRAITMSARCDNCWDICRSPLPVRRRAGPSGNL